MSCYDYDQKFPVFGFGGKPRTMIGDVMCFNLNEKEDPEIHTIEGVKNIYRTKTPQIELWGTNWVWTSVKEVD